MAATPVSVAVFYDWQNVYKTAREAFGSTNMPSEYGNFSPYQLCFALDVSEHVAAESAPRLYIPKSS